MKTNITTCFGKQTQTDLIINNISAYDIKPGEEAIALEKGFSINIINNIDNWFLSRNTRINLLNSCHKPMHKQYYKITDIMPKEFINIYNIYINKKGYTDLYNITDNKRFKYISYIHNDIIVAISILMQYVDAIESHLFVWNYETPSLNIGYNSLLNEIAYAKDNDYHYLYTGPGYETNCIYKSEFQGFEWFTGNEWSRDIELYKELCLRDSNIKNFNDLSYLTS